MPKASNKANSPFTNIPASEDINVGQRLRVIRAERGLSIKALAELSRLNVNTLGLIENGRTSPSVSTLQQPSQSLQIPVRSFFETDHGQKKITFQKSGTRPRAVFAHGIMEDLAAGMSRFGAEPLIVTLAARTDSGKMPIVHTAANQFIV